jgi:hypothetical protein
MKIRDRVLRQNRAGQALRALSQSNERSYSFASRAASRATRLASSSRVPS